MGDAGRCILSENNIKSTRISDPLPETAEVKHTKIGIYFRRDIGDGLSEGDGVAEDPPARGILLDQRELTFFQRPYVDQPLNESE
jgi:hypothetical protein